MKKADREKKLLMCASRSSHLAGFHTPWLKWFSENGWQVFTASQGEGTMWGEHLSLPFEKRLISLKNLGSLWQLTKFIRREKFRLRYYGADTSFLRLEKKYKINGLCGKRSARMTQEQVKELLSGSSEFLLDSDEPLFIELYSKIKGKGLWPKAIVRYDREAFLYAPGNVRITLDRDIRTGLGNVDFLNPAIFYMRTMEPGTVLEVKYDAFLPELVRMAVQVPGRQAAACSKYALCRRFD